MSDYLSGQQTLEQITKSTDVEGLNLITRGQIPPNPSELLMHENFSNLITEIKDKYDIIIIDTPPINAVSDALIIAKQADSLMYVVKSDDTRTGVVRNGVGRLVDANIKIAGIVLNKVDIRASANSDYYYGYYSDKAYGSAVKTNTSESIDILTDKADPEDKLQLSS